MGRMAILIGIAILGYGYYTHTTQPIVSLVAYSLIGIGAILYFLTDLK